MKLKILIAISCFALFALNPYPFKILELQSFDWLMKSQPEVQNQNIVLVDIDEEIVEAYGGYPLPRTLFASMIKNTSGVPGFTILMPDPDLRDSNNDIILSQVLNSKPTVLAYAASTQASKLGPHVGTAQIGGDPSEWLLKYPGILRQTQILSLAAEGKGIVNSRSELDGVVRRVPLVVGSGGKVYPSFALEMLRLGTNDISYQIKTGEFGVEWVRVPAYNKMNTDSNGNVWLNCLLYTSPSPRDRG